MRRPLRVGQLAMFPGSVRSAGLRLFIVTKRAGSKVIVQRLGSNERAFGCYRHDIMRVVVSFVGPVYADDDGH